MNADLPMYDARRAIAIEVTDVAMQIPLVEERGVDVRGGNRTCVRLTARRVKCHWKIEAFVCDVDFTNCDPAPVYEVEGDAWATKTKKNINVELLSDSRRHGVSASH